MGAFIENLNDILIETYFNILQLEEYTLKKSDKIQLSIREMHLIECVGKGGNNGKTIKELAEMLFIKPPSVTVAVNKLAAKGYLTKESCTNDGRVVNVYLTREGQRIDAYHKYYHRRMVRKISETISEDDQEVLLKLVTKINEYFREIVGEQSDDF